MTTAIISGLVLAAISGAVFVAYNHPRSYQSSAKKVGLVLAFIFLVTLAAEFCGKIYNIWLPDLPSPEAKKVLSDYNTVWLQIISIIQVFIIGLVLFGVFLIWVSKLKNTSGNDWPKHAQEYENTQWRDTAFEPKPTAPWV
jgi:drug/metabolite transporter (DMT)-like permease